jgi:hypothetical protein
VLRVARQVRDSMTPGQRQTAAIGAVLAACALAFGLPAKSVVRSAAAAPARPAPSAATAPRAKPAPVAAPVLAAAPASFGAGPVESSGIEPPLEASSASPPRLVAVVRPGESSVPGRDEPDIATAFLEAAQLSATTIALDPADPAMCQKITAAGDIVITGRSLGADLRGCVVAAGRTVVSYDEIGSLLGTAPDAGQVVSTRRGMADSLLDLARWSQGSGALKGRVGIVSVKSAAPTLAAIARGLRDLGVNVVDTALVADDQTSTADVANGVLDFSSKGVEVVLFAAPVAVQQRWVAQSAVLAPSSRYVVSDAYDGIASETYPVSFDGAVSYTSLRVPWYARAHGESAAQSRCDATWNAAATPPTTLPGAEMVLVYQWCQNVALVSAALQQASNAHDFGAAVRAVSLPAPLTSDLGPLAGGGFGPMQSAALVWRSSCVCWQETQAFADRPSS